MDIFNFNSLEDLGAFSQKQKDNHLLFVASKSDVEDIKKLALLIEAGANVNMSCFYSGFTPLIAAVTSGHIVSVVLLIQAGATLNTSNMLHETALSRAIVKNYSDKAFLLSFMMSKNELNHELKLNYLRICTFEAQFVDMTQSLEKLTEQKKLLLAKALVPLWPSHPNAPNFFSILPLELKHLISFKYWAVTQNILLQTFCSEESPPKPLIFSSGASKVKKYDEQQPLCTQFSALSTEITCFESQKENKSKRKKGCIIF